MSTPVSAVHAEYTQRSQARRREAQIAWSSVRAIGRARLVVFFSFFVLAWMVTERGLFPAAWLWVPVAGFVWLVRRHRAAYDAWERARRAGAFYDDGLHRLDDAWAGRGVTGDRFRDGLHPYTCDLDVFGPGSLFELLCGARTAAGEETLAGWLRGAALVEPNEPAAEVVDRLRQRQSAVAELRDRLDLREALATVCSERSVIDHEALVRWAQAPVTLTSTALRAVAAVLGAATFAALLWWAFGNDARPFLVLFVIEQLFALVPRGAVWDVMRGLDRPRRDLALLSAFLERIEGESFQAPLLARLRARIDEGASARLRALITRMELAESWRNIFFAPFAVVLLWALQFAFSIERWRAVNGARVAEWIAALAELEALLSLASFAFENPDDVFATLEPDGPRFDAVGVAHPLLPRDGAVRNDVRLDARQQLMLVSGSNMAGKSSLLRTVGVSVVLGLSGATVRARSLVLSPLCAGACMRLQDSLQQGVSLFYAEITRLRQIVDMAGNEDRPLLFLLDEILAGTNSYDRSIGAEAVVRTLVSRGAIGLVTTHDLALTHIVEALAGRAINVHFQDDMVDGRMRFDYRLRAGVVERSNAIALMRAVGLEV